MLETVLRMRLLKNTLFHEESVLDVIFVTIGTIKVLHIFPESHAMSVANKANNT